MACVRHVHWNVRITELAAFNPAIVKLFRWKVGVTVAFQILETLALEVGGRTPVFSYA